jgi:signal transduction histidine kinase
LPATAQLLTAESIAPRQGAVHEAPACEEIRVLVIEDDPLYGEIIAYRLKRSRDPIFRSVRQGSLREGLVALRDQTFDVILLDLSLPDSDGIETIECVRGASPRVPVVVLTGLGAQEVALRALHKGAQDYLVKGNDEELIIRSVRYAVERSRTLAELGESQRKLEVAQMQLIQAEKMETVGRLSAGIAHEVKNPLAIIQMGVDFLRKRPVSSDPLAVTAIDDIDESVARALAIVQGLLDFSVPRQLDLNPTQLNEVIEQTIPLVKHARDAARVGLAMELEHGLPDLQLDAHKIRQVLLNLLLNAIHAMPDGGTLTVRTYGKHLTQVGGIVGFRTTDKFRPGDRVVVAEVLDTGTGIAPDILPKLFEPFFTTKKRGSGTGLGLPITRNLVELHGGHLSLANRIEGGAKATITFVA